MTYEQWLLLLSPEGQGLLAEISQETLTEANHLLIAARLREQAPPALAQAVIETVWLRQRAEEKFTRATRMYFTRPALEQASAEIVSTHRAQRFFEIGARRVADLGCGIGGDALALAAGAEVIGLDKNLVRLAMARENIRAYGLDRRFKAVQADLLDQEPVAVDALFFDPARRDERGRRLKSVHRYRPPLCLIEPWLQLVPDTAVKVSPAVDYAEIPTEAESEFISVAGAVKECVFWYGDLRRGAGRRATLLPSGHSLAAGDLPQPDLQPREPGAYLYEPDGAVIRAHLVQQLGQLIGAAPIDAEIAYLTADAPLDTPFARGFAIDDWFPFQLKRLRHYLRERGIGRVTIKKRGSPLEPATLQSRLRLQGDEHRIVFLTHVLGAPAVLIGRAISADHSP
ncbi:MAG: THUMP-like domain-containing protein [Candidatus Promineifilaceae bacterium]